MTQGGNWQCVCSIGVAFRGGRERAQDVSGLYCVTPASVKLSEPKCESFLSQVVHNGRHSRRPRNQLEVET